MSNVAGNWLKRGQNKKILHANFVLWFPQGLQFYVLMVRDYILYFSQLFKQNGELRNLRSKIITSTTVGSSQII